MLSYFARGRLYVNLTGSLPIGVYRRLDGVPQRGDLMIACLPRVAARLAFARGYLWAGACPGDVAPIGKSVVAVSGDTVTASASGVEVNSTLLRHTIAAARDSRGRTMDRVPNGKYVVHENEMWLLSTHHPLSFDSRYFGPIEMTDVLARVRPLWQWGNPKKRVPSIGSDGDENREIPSQ